MPEAWQAKLEDAGLNTSHFGQLAQYFQKQEEKRTPTEAIARRHVTRQTPPTKDRPGRQGKQK